MDEELNVPTELGPDGREWIIGSSRLEETFKMMQLNCPPSNTTVTPKPLNHLTQHHIQLPLEQLQGWWLPLGNICQHLLYILRINSFFNI